MSSDSERQRQPYGQQEHCLHFKNKNKNIIQKSGSGQIPEP